MPAGGGKPPDNKVRPPGPGNRTDMQGTQPIRVPSGLPYGDRAKLEGMQQAVPLPAATGGPGGISGGTPPAAPAELGAMLGAAPTQRPAEPVTTSAGQGVAEPLEEVDESWVEALMELAQDPRSDAEVKALALTMMHAFATGGNEFFPEGL